MISSLLAFRAGFAFLNDRQHFFSKKFTIFKTLLKHEDCIATSLFDHNSSNP